MELESKIPKDLEVLADAYTLNIEAANRSWLALISICITAILARPSDPETITFLSIAINTDAFYGVSLMVISALNIHYCSNQMMTYEFSKNYGQYLADIDAENIKISSNTNLREIAYKMIKPNYVRLFPLTLGMSSTLRGVFMKTIKPTVDVIYTVLPMSCIIYQIRFGYIQLMGGTEVDIFSYGLFIAASVLAAISIGSSLIMAARVFGWQRIMRGF